LDRYLAENEHVGTQNSFDRLALILRRAELVQAPMRKEAPSRKRAESTPQKKATRGLLPIAAT
jgi:hypothetical protein